MRTTVTLDPDLDAKIRRLAHERGISFKEALNISLRAGLGVEAGARPYVVRPRHLGLKPGMDLTKALQLSSALEDEETVRKLERRK